MTRDNRLGTVTAALLAAVLLVGLAGCAKTGVESTDPTLPPLPTRVPYRGSSPRFGGSTTTPTTSTLTVEAPRPKTSTEATTSSTTTTSPSSSTSSSTSTNAPTRPTPAECDLFAQLILFTSSVQAEVGDDPAATAAKVAPMVAQSQAGLDQILATAPEAISADATTLVNWLRDKARGTPTSTDAEAAASLEKVRAWHAASCTK